MKAVLPFIAFAYLLASGLCAQSTSWGINGNTGISTNCFIGTTDLHPLKLRTGNVDQMVIAPDGKVAMHSLQGNGPGYLIADQDGNVLRVDPGNDSLFNCAYQLWRANGNFVKPECFIGSTNAMPLRIHTHSQERMRVTESGLVGIGTTAPQAQLHIYTANGPARLQLESGSNLAPPEVCFWTGPFGNAATLELAAIRGFFDLGVLRSGLSFAVNPGGAAVGTVEVMRLDPLGAELSGRMAVGTSMSTTDRLALGGSLRIQASTQPTASLHLAHDGASARIQASTGAGSTPTLLLNPLGGGVQAGGTLYAPALALGTSSLSDSGRTYILSVNGAARAKGFRTYPTWSDYVFAADYPLMPLPEVEAYIQTHQHLPGIPSAATVAREGIELGASQAALLAKVEELTLHLIALDKENQAIKVRLAELEGKGK
jgi:hypothetical protein